MGSRHGRAAKGLCVLLTARLQTAAARRAACGRQPIVSAPPAGLDVSTAQNVCACHAARRPKATLHLSVSGPSNAVRTRVTCLSFASQFEGGSRTAANSQVLGRTLQKSHRAVQFRPLQSFRREVSVRAVSIIAGYSDYGRTSAGHGRQSLGVLRGRPTRGTPSSQPGVEGAPAGGTSRAKLGACGHARLAGTCQPLHSAMGSSTQAIFVGPARCQTPRRWEPRRFKDLPLGQLGLSARKRKASCLMGPG